MAGLTTNQVKFKLTTAAYSASNTASNGDIVFYYDSTKTPTNAIGSRKIYARGVEWYGSDTHYGNSFKVYQGSTEVVSFTQDKDTSINFKQGDGITMSASNGTITIAHSTAAGYKHIPTGGSAGKYLVYSSAGTADWSSSTIGSSTKPIYINAGVPTAINYTLGQNVTSSSKFTDTTYTLYTGAASNITANSTSDAANPYLALHPDSGSNSAIQFTAGTGLSVSAKNGVVTIGAASGYKIPTSTEVTNWNSAYTWYNTNVATKTDTDTVINKWEEIISFLAGASDASTLAQYLDLKADIGHTHDIVSSTKDGFAPKIGTAAAATISTQADEWVLTSTNGATPTWRALPQTAFQNTTYSASYTVKVDGTQRGKAYTPSVSAATNFVNGSATDTTKFTSSTASTTETGTITVSGPSLIAATGTAGTTTAYNATVQADTLFWYDL